jgi:hypothetical protein
LPVVRTPELVAALRDASTEVGLQEWYRDCVWPLLGMPRERWPHCCGSGCEPCNATLVAVAEKVLDRVASVEID